MNKQVESKKNEKVTESLLTVLTSQDLGLSVNVETQVSYAIWIRALMQNWRQGTVGVKTRGEVSFSNKKPWKQKGTGRARAGSARSPLWRSGGILFGPQPRVRTLKVNKQTKVQVLAACLANFADKGSFFAIDWILKNSEPSTSLAHNVFKEAGLNTQKVVVFMDRNDHTVWASLNNLPYVHVVTFDDVNAYEVSLGSCIVVMKKDVNILERNGVKMELSIYDIIVGPVVSNKAYRLYQTLKQMTLQVHPQANKTLIAQAMNKLFNVKAESIRIIVRKGKRKISRSRNVSVDNLRKIAIVTLKQGQEINFFGDAAMAVEHAKVEQSTHAQLNS